MAELHPPRSSPSRAARRRRQASMVASYKTEQCCGGQQQLNESSFTLCTDKPSDLTTSGIITDGRLLGADEQTPTQTLIPKPALDSFLDEGAHTGDLDVTSVPERRQMQSQTPDFEHDAAHTGRSVDAHNYVGIISAVSPGDASTQKQEDIMKQFQQNCEDMLKQYRLGAAAINKQILQDSAVRLGLPVDPDGDSAPHVACQTVACQTFNLCADDNLDIDLEAMHDLDWTAPLPSAGSGPAVLSDVCEDEPFTQTSILPSAAALPVRDLVTEAVSCDCPSSNCWRPSRPKVAMDTAYVDNIIDPDDDGFHNWRLPWPGDAIRFGTSYRRRPPWPGEAKTDTRICHDYVDNFIDPYEDGSLSCRSPWPGEASSFEDAPQIL